MGLDVRREASHTSPNRGFVDQVSPVDSIHAFDMQHPLNSPRDLNCVRSAGQQNVWLLYSFTLSPWKALLGMRTSLPNPSSKSDLASQHTYGHRACKSQLMPPPAAIVESAGAGVLCVGNGGQGHLPCSSRNERPDESLAHSLGSQLHEGDLAAGGGGAGSGEGAAPLFRDPTIRFVDLLSRVHSIRSDVLASAVLALVKQSC